MHIDDLKDAWAGHGAMLERSLTINERLLREVLLRKVRFALSPYVVWKALELAIGIAALLVVMSVFADHIAEPRYIVVAGALAVFAAWITALCAYLLVNALRLDYGGAVTALQRDVARIKMVEYRALKWALLGGVLLWLPALLVPFEALTGIDALGRVPLAYLVANLVVGLIVFVAGMLWSTKYVEQPNSKFRTRQWVDALSGRSLQRAAGHLAELSTFEREEPPTL